MVIDNGGLDQTKIQEKTIYELRPKWKECVIDGGVWREKTIVDSIWPTFKGFLDGLSEKAFEIISPTAVAGVRG